MRDDQEIYVLGETHLKGKQSHELGQQILSNFRGFGCVGTEGVGVVQYPWWVRGMIEVVMFPLYTFTKPFVHASTIHIAMNDKLVKQFRLEEGRQPCVREYLYIFYLFTCVLSFASMIFYLIFGWKICNDFCYYFSFFMLYELVAMTFPSPFMPCLSSGILVGRDKYMAEKALANVSHEPLLMIVGKNHMSGIGKHLQAAGFVKQEIV